MRLDAESLILSISIQKVLGAFGCSSIPFIQTSTIVIQSLSLVTIALDRYLAVLNVSKSPKFESKTICFSCMIVVWLLSCAISSPTLFRYKHKPVYVVPDRDLDYFYVGYVCVTDTVGKSTIVDSSNQFHALNFHPRHRMNLQPSTS
jgi:7 transmembrane receptor (rhodopsin family)